MGIHPQGLYTHDQLKPTLILLLSAILPTVHLYLGSIEFAQKTFPSFGEFETSTFMFFSMFFLMGIIPLLIIKLVFKEALKDYGIRFGDWRNGLPLSIILLLIITGLMLFPSAQVPEFRDAYPFDKTAGDSIFNFLRFEILRGLFFYTAWEFFFRGFILFGLKKYVGDWLAICIQTIPSCLWHVGLPTGEIFASIAAGILFGIIAVRTHSILWIFILHYLIGVLLDLFIII